MSCFVSLVQDADASHANPYACAGSRQLTCQSLRLCKLPKIHIPILTLVKVPQNGKNSLHLCRLPEIHTPILTLVKVAKMLTNSYACAGSQEFTRQFLCLCRLPTIHTPILTPVQAPNNSHANPYACEGSQKGKKFLTPVQAFNNSHANPYACEGCQQCRQILTPVQAPDNSNANPYACAGAQQFTRQSLCLFRLPETDTPILTLVKVPDNLNNSIHD
ncbi:hypothetical protein O181_114333 [Austropuccinia psidii MF-1]|uniref:Uncharacterized protein n=1 Tax=Austropuccinia psidii MF-1 TaxID=1389203 RepID=A0A9Q3K4K4_9BASI|nr:hypothetical protein [Austropuccinia psidii MF-1]